MRSENFRAYIQLNLIGKFGFSHLCLRNLWMFKFILLKYKIFWMKIATKNTERFKYNVMLQISKIVSILIVYLSSRLTNSCMALKIIGCLVSERGQKILKISSKFCLHSNLIRKKTFSLEINDSRSGFRKITIRIRSSQIIWYMDETIR